MAESVGNIGFVEGEFDRSYSDETAKVLYSTYSPDVGR
jgi:hypothetical protein